MHTAIKDISLKHQLEVIKEMPIAGGDINQVFLLKCSSGDYVLKLNSDAQFPKMFEAEAAGLKLLATSNSFHIPEAAAFGTSGEFAYLLMDYVESGVKGDDFWGQFASSLVKLHKVSSSEYGLDHSNYIGSLPQQNNPHKDPASFYIHERLEPQLKLAADSGYSFSNPAVALKHIAQAIPEEAPSLIHGDLWSGNYLVSAAGLPVLIDPAVAYGSREMDLAMMLLFGGFSSEVFIRYDELFPLTENWKERVSLWQLYYLLVHLNLFGSGYLSRVQDILRMYT